LTRPTELFAYIGVFTSATETDPKNDSFLEHANCNVAASFSSGRRREVPLSAICTRAQRLHMQRRTFSRTTLLVLSGCANQPQQGHSPTRS
jgi:hypothetical protein